MLVGDLQGWNDALHTGDLLLAQEQVGILKLTLLTWKQKTDVSWLFLYSPVFNRQVWIKGMVWII